MASKSLTVSANVVTSMANFVKGCSDLVDSTEKFGNQIEKLLIEGIEKLKSLKHSYIKNEYKAKTAFEDVLLVSRHAFMFVDKVDDIFYYGKETKIARDELYNNGNI